MTVRRVVQTLFVAGAATSVGGALGERMSHASDAPLWTWLPWGLLGVFWIFVGLKLRDAKHGGPE